MTEDNITRERTLAYAAGYEAGKADAAKEPLSGETKVAVYMERAMTPEEIRDLHDGFSPCGVVLTEEERETLLIAARILNIHTYQFQADAIHDILARSAQPADTVTVRREVLQQLVDFIRWATTQARHDLDSLDDLEADPVEREAIAEAEAALAAQPKGDAE